MPRITDDNHGPKLILAVGLMLVYTLIALAIRLIARWPGSIRGARVEDIVLIAAVVSSIGYTASVCVAVSHNFGHHEDDISPQNIHSLRKALLTSILFFFLTEGLANWSYSLFLQSLSNIRERRLAFWLVYASIAAVTLAGFVSSVVSIGQNQALSTYVLTVLGAIEITILLAVFALNAWTIWNLQMVRLRRMKATLWFSVVLLLIGVIIARLVKTPSDLFRPNYTFNCIQFFIFLTVEMHLSVMNAAYPTLLAFVSKATTGFMNTTPGLSSSKAGPSSGKSSKQRKNSAKEEDLKLRNDTLQQVTDIGRGSNRESLHLENGTDRIIMVSKSVTID